MQGHGGLAGPRSALDQQDAGQGVADDLVLLALDGRHDVAHAPGARAPQGREQRAGTPEGKAAVHEPLLGGGPLGAVGQLQLAALVGEVLVLDAQHLAGANGHVAPARQAQGLDAGGPVEGLGDRRAPVDHQGVEVGVGDGQAPDVIGVAGSVGAVEVVDAPEEEGLVADRQLVEAVQGGAHDDVALHEVARAAHVRHGRRVAQGTGLIAHVVEGVQRSVEELLLLGDLALVCHTTSPGLETASDDSR